MMPPHERTRSNADRSWLQRSWPVVLVSALISVQAVQIAAQSYGNPGFGIDFALLYCASHVWAEGGDPYDDAAIKDAWKRHGDAALPAPGRPITPNVYPLTIAPLIRPLAQLPFGAAIILWLAIILAAEAWLILLVLRSANQGTAIRLIPVAVAVAILMLSYPTRLSLASLNIGMITGMLGLYAVSRSTNTWRAGLALGLSLVKYSVTGPLVLLLLWRRSYRVVAVCVGVQIVLVSVSTWGGRSVHPFEWLGSMQSEIAASLAPGAINSHDAVLGGAMHLGLRSLWHRLAPTADNLHWPVVAVLGVVAVMLIARSKRTPHAGSRPDSDLAIILAFTLIAFYHRAYDLYPLMVLTAAWLVRPRASTRAYEPAEYVLWAALAWTVVPGIWAGWDQTTSPAWIRLAVQPACAWAALATCLATMWVLNRRQVQNGISIGASTASLSSAAAST